MSEYNRSDDLGHMPEWGLKLSMLHAMQQKKLIVWDVWLIDDPTFGKTVASGDIITSDEPVSFLEPTCD